MVVCGGLNESLDVGVGVHVSVRVSVGVGVSVCVCVFLLLACMSVGSTPISPRCTSAGPFP